MKITRADIHYFSIPLVRPIKVGGKNLTSRSGFIAALRDGEGRWGFGEAAPLPGLDNVSLDLCNKNLNKACRELAGARLTPELFDPEAPFLGMTDIPLDTDQFTAFGVESALFQLIRPNSAGHKIKVNGLMVPGGLTDQFEGLKKAGFSTIKIKIGRLKPEHEIREILELWDFLTGEAALRLDCNGSLTPAVYQKYFDALKHLNIEYVEEPLPDGNFESARKIPWALAADESLGKWPNLNPLPDGVKAAIIKPGTYFGFHGMIKALKRFNDAGVRTVLSSSFNTGVGLWALAAASSFAKEDVAHGFDTIKYLEKDVLTDQPAMQNGFLNFSNCLGKNTPVLNENAFREFSG